MRFGSYRVSTFPVGPTIQITIAASRQHGDLCLKNPTERLSVWRQVIGWDCGASRPQRAAGAQFCRMRLEINVALGALLRAGRPRSQPIT